MNFSWWKDDDIKKSSVFKLEDSKDLNDLRLGATTTEPCQTCFLKWKQCPGHFSYYEFKYPVIHPMMTWCRQPKKTCVKFLKLTLVTIDQSFKIVYKLIKMAAEEL